ncbi:hypothetical protein [uncultured Rubinisphaera sp.]|uniref:hypothetical protein n=1 Tax=uncultured Rubinisphaera sp. TaxID=1678686 RepID=UPI0030D937A2
MNSTNVEKSFNRLIATHLSSLGFKYSKDSEVFARNNDDRADSFSLIFVDHASALKVSMCMAVSYCRFAELLSHANKLPIHYYKYSSTVMSSITADDADSELVLHLVRESDLEEKVALALTAFHDQALDYYSKFSSLEAVDKAVNKDPSAPCREMPNFERRAMVGAIVACLLGRSDSREIIGEHREMLLTYLSGIHVRTFDRLIEILDPETGRFDLRTQME